MQSCLIDMVSCLKQMLQDTNDTNPEEAVSCIALSKNDSYVMSVSGGKVSLFNDNDTYADDVIMKVTVAFRDST
jgi:hypothetical protein